MIRNIIFDWSGTLVDDLPAVWRATNFVFNQAGIAEITLEQFRAEFCLPFSRFYERHLPHVAMAQLEDWFHACLKQVQYSVVELPHARAFLEFCKERSVRTFLLSSVHTDHYAVQSQATGLGAFIDQPYVQVWDKRSKINEIVQEHQLAPDETLFIGDMQHDVETAKHGGIHSCAVLTGYNSLAQLRVAEPDLIVEHLAELRQILERHHFDLKKAAAVDEHLQPVITVGALIFNSQKEALMIQTHKWSNLWGIPGGKTGFGETSLDALRREIKEETDLEITDIEFVLVQDCIHSREFYRDAHFVLLNYTCRCVGEPNVKLNEEAIRFRWLSIEKALELPLNTPTRVLLEAVGTLHQNAHTLSKLSQVETRPNRQS